jgi:hypothetical protein
LKILDGEISFTLENNIQSDYKFILLYDPLTLGCFSWTFATNIQLSSLPFLQFSFDQNDDRCELLYMINTNILHFEIKCSGKLFQLTSQLAFAKKIWKIISLKEMQSFPKKEKQLCQQNILLYYIHFQGVVFTLPTGTFCLQKFNVKKFEIFWQFGVRKVFKIELYYSVIHCYILFLFSHLLYRLLTLLHPWYFPTVLLSVSVYNKFQFFYFKFLLAK